MVKIHNERKPFKCEICDYVSAFDSNLIKHIRNIHLKSNKKNPQSSRKIKKDVENSIKNECYETIKSLQKQIISDSEDENTKKMNNRKPRKPKSSQENDNPYKKVYKSSHRKPIQRNTEDIDFMNIKSNITVSQIEEINTDDMC